MRGILCHLTAKQAGSVGKKKELAIALSDSDRRLLEAEVKGKHVVAVIGVDQCKRDGKWLARLSGQVASFPKSTDTVKLKYVNIPSGDGCWELPEGFPSSPFFEREGYELLREESEVKACLLGASLITKALGDIKPPILKGFTKLLKNPFTDALIVTFDAHGPRVSTINSVRNNVICDKASYEKVLEGFLADLPEKGQDFEFILKELFTRPEFGFDSVNVTGRGGDGGIDLELRRDRPIVGREVYLVQAKNTVKRVAKTQVDALRGAAAGTPFCTKAIFVSRGGFTHQARESAQGNAGVNPVELIGLEDLARLIWSQVDSMPDTRARLDAWRRREQDGQGALLLIDH